MVHPRRVRGFASGGRGVRGACGGLVAGAVFAVALVGPAAAQSGAGAAVRFARPHLYAGHFAVEPRMPLAADLDGDGYADLACVYPPDGGILDVGLSERGLKMHAHTAPARGLFGEAIAAAARPGAVAWITREGAVGAFADGRLERVGEAPGGEAIVGLASGWLVARRSGAWTLFGPAGPREVRGPRAWRALAAFGDTVFWTDGDALHRGAVEGDALTDAWRPGAGRAERLVAGDFDGDGRADVVAGDVLHLGSAPAPAPLADLGVPHADTALWLAADVTGDGRSDLLIARRDGDRFRGRDILLLVSIAPVAPGAEGAADADQDGLTDERERRLGSDPLARDTDGDGIPDGWEVDGAGGLDLAAEGFHPARKDVLCYVQRRVDTDGARARADLERCRAYFATLDPPIALHIRYLRPLAVDEAHGKPWWELGEAHLPKAVRGLAHYMVTGPGSGGQSAQLGTMGGCGADALYATFLHELGHQLGLDHTGFYPEAWCPLYTSLMNYAYNYAFDGDGAKIHYSKGTFAGVELNERALDETLPFPLERVRFLAKGPFHFRLEADGEERTRIDWNRNGRFDAEPVRADINTSYSTSGGHRSTIGKTTAAPALVSHDGHAYLYAVEEGRRLVRRTYEGGERWSEPAPRLEVEARGDPLVLVAGARRLVFLPTARGVVWFDDAAAPPPGAPRTGAAATTTLSTVPSSEGCEVSGVVLAGQPLLFLWQEGAVRVSALADGGFAAPVPFPLASTFPPGVVAAPGGGLLVGVGEDQDRGRTSRWRLYEVAVTLGSAEPSAAGLEGGAGASPTPTPTPTPPSPPAAAIAGPAAPRVTFAVGASRWVGGEGAHDAGDRRPNLIWEAAEERLHWISTGRIGQGPEARGCFWDAMTIGDRTFRDGWLLKRYYDEWTVTPSAVAACWHEDDILLACRWWKSDDLFVAHRGLGIGDQPMRDFDDQAHMAEVGIERSILWMAPKGLRAQEP